MTLQEQMAGAQRVNFGTGIPLEAAIRIAERYALEQQLALLKSFKGPSYAIDDAVFYSIQDLEARIRALGHTTPENIHIPIH
jgi:hypothetical protein